MDQPGATLFKGQRNKEGSHVKLKKEAPLEPSLALPRPGLNDIAPQKICGSTAPIKTALNVNFKKKTKIEK